MKLTKLKVYSSIKFLLSFILLLGLSLSFISCTPDAKQRNNQQNQSSNKTSASENMEENSKESETSPQITEISRSEEKASQNKTSTSSKKTAAESKTEAEIEEDSELAAYLEAVKTFEEVSIKDLRAAAAKTSGDKLVYAYLGSESCPFCLNLAPVLAELKEEYDLQVLYIDSDKNGSDDDLIDDFLEFIEEKNLRTIPALFIIENKDIKQVKIKAPYTVGKLEKLLELSSK